MILGSVGGGAIICRRLAFGRRWERGGRRRESLRLGFRLPHFRPMPSSHLLAAGDRIELRSLSADAVLRGVDPLTVGILAGHKDATMAMKVYGLVAKDMQFLAVKNRQATDEDQSA